MCKAFLHATQVRNHNNTDTHYVRFLFVRFIKPSHVTLVVNREGGPNTTVGPTGNQMKDARSLVQIIIMFIQPRNLRSPCNLVSWGRVPLLRPRPLSPNFTTWLRPV